MGTADLAATAARVTAAHAAGMQARMAGTASATERSNASAQRGRHLGGLNVFAASMLLGVSDAGYGPTVMRLAL